MRTHVHVFAPRASRPRRAGDEAPRSLLGPHGSQLVELAENGWPVLPGFVVSADVCAYAARHAGALPPALDDELETAWSGLKRAAPPALACPRAPMLAEVAFDAGAVVRNPTPPVFGIGYSSTAHPASSAPGEDGPGADPAGVIFLDSLGRLLWGPRWAGSAMREGGSPRDRRLRLQEAWTARNGGEPPPEHPLDQLRLILRAAYAAWNTPAAMHRRARAAKSGVLGPAVLVRLWVSGGGRGTGGWGRVSSRNPETGRRGPSGVFYPDVFQRPPDPEPGSGIRIERLSRHANAAWRRIGRDAAAWANRLEHDRKYPQEIEFVASEGHGFIREVSAARPHDGAAVRWACEMTSARGASGRSHSLKRLTPAEALQTLSPLSFAAVFDHAYGSGRPRAAGASAGTAQRARERAMCRKISAWIQAYQPMTILAEAGGPDELRRIRAFGASGFCLPPPSRAPSDPALARARTLTEAEAAARTYARAVAPEWEPWVRAAHTQEIHLTVRSTLSAPAVTALARSLAAALAAGRTHGYEARGRVMIGGFSDWTEFDALAAGVRRTAESAREESGLDLDLQPGALIETPRSALLADRGADSAGILCFHLSALDRALRGGRPAATGFDPEGLGGLLEQSLRAVRRIQHDLPCGACGVPVEDAAALRFLHRLGFVFLCCPTDQIPAARLAAAQAAIARMDSHP